MIAIKIQGVMKGYFSQVKGAEGGDSEGGGHLLALFFFFFFSFLRAPFSNKSIDPK